MNVIKRIYIIVCGQVAADFGGPRKEFFQLALLEIKEKYFDHGLRQHLSEDYLVVGKLLGKQLLGFFLLLFNMVYEYCLVSQNIFFALD